MVSLQLSAGDVGIRDVGFGIVVVAAVALTLVAQLLSMIVFDSTGLDVYAPDAVFMNIVPALVLALVPAVVASRLYGRRGGIAAGAVVFATVLAVSTYTADFFALCGARC